MEKLSYKTLFTIVVVLLIGIVALLRIQQKPTSVLAEWFNDAWTYRQAINISSHSVGETNVYITTSINIGTTAKSQVDNGDFRFTTTSGQLLDYYIVSGTGTANISFHIKFDSFPAGAQTVLAYYGNPSAPNGFSSADFTTAASSYAIGSVASEEVGGGPVAWWKFDEGVGTSAFDATDSRNNSYFGPGTSSPSWVDESQCISGKCVRFDGNDYLTASSYPNLSTELTYNLWIKRNNVTGQQGLISINRTMLQITEAQIDWYSDVDISLVSQTTTLNPNQWYMVTVTQSGTNYSIYKDGQLIKSSTTAAIDNTNTSKLIGTYLTTWRPYSGMIDDVKIYPYARSANQIKQDYASGLAGQSSSNSSVNIGSNSNKSLSEGLISYWKFDEGVGTSSVDSSGNSTTAIFTGTSAPTWSSGKYGVGVSFDRSNDYFNTALSNINGTAGGYNSVSYWMYWKGNTNDIVFSFGSYYDLWFPTATCFGFNTGAGEAYGFNPTGLANKWVHVVANFYNGAYTGKNEIYIDGVKQTLTQCAGSAQSKTLTSSLTFILGNLLTGGGYSFGGSIDEFRIYNRGLSATDVKSLYNYSPGPVGYWKFDEGSGTTGSDSSGNNRTATLQNGAGFAPGKYGHALSLNIGSSANQYASFTTINHNYSFTKEAWINPIDTTQCGETRCTVISPYFEILSNLQYYDYSMVASPGWHTGGSIPLNKWTHVALSYNQSNVKLFVNGIEVKNTATGSTDVHNSWAIGAYSSNNRNFRGQIDDVKIYDYARTTEQILQDMAGDSATVPKNSQPIIYYKFDEGTSNVVNNYGIGGSLYHADFGTGTSAPTWTNGKNNKGLSFDGDNDSTSLNSFYFPNAENFTLSTWFNITTGTTAAYDVPIFGNDQYTSLLGYVPSTKTFRQLKQYTGGVGSTTINWVTTYQYADSNWHYVAVSVDQGTTAATLYLDGKKYSAISIGGTEGYTHSNGAFRRIGRNYGVTMNGSVDEMKVYNYALSADEIKSDYNQNASFVFGTTNQTVGGTSTNLEYCVPGDTSPCAAPIAEYKMDEGVGTTVFDSSGNNKNGVFTNSPTWKVGKHGKGVYFGSGSNQYIKLPTNAISGLTTFTISTWAYRDTNSATALFATEGGGPYWRSVDGTGFYLYLLDSDCNNGGQVWNVANAFMTGWHHYSLSIAADGTLKFYRDGVLISTVNYSVWGGQVWDSVCPTASYWNAIGNYASINGLGGTVDDFKIYNYARTPAQVSYDYNKGSPVAWWKLDDCQGPVANNSINIGDSASVTIGASGSQSGVGTCSTASTAWGVGSTGKVSSALNLDGTDDYANTSSTSLLTSAGQSTTKGSWGGWFYPTSTTSKTLIEKASTFELITTASGQAQCAIYYTAGFHFGNAIDISTNTWQNIYCVYDGSNIITYLNGKITDTKAETNSITESSSVLYLGQSSANNRRFGGQLDDIRIYNYPLTSTQVKTIYNGGGINFK